MAYVLVIFMSYGFHGPSPVEFYGKSACEAAKQEIAMMQKADNSTMGIRGVLCLPKSAAQK